MVEVGPTNGYVHVDKDTLRRIRGAGEHQLVFQASGMRAERTGFHARIEILMDGTPIAHDTFNVERNADRVTLANTAYGMMLPPSATKTTEFPGYPKTFLKNDLDRFCAGLQDAYVEGLLPKLMEGSTERQVPEFILKPYVLKDGGTILFAPPGQGKSYVLWLMAVSITHGIDKLWPVAQAKVLVVNLERSERSVADRLGNINSVLGLPRRTPLHVLNARGRTLEQMRSAIARYVKREGIEVILLDSLSRAGKGSLVDDDVVNAYCDILNGFEVAWLALAHSPRADTTHVFGSQMFDAAADLMVRLDSYTRLNGVMGVSLDVTKRNDIGQQSVWVGTLQFDDAGLLSARTATKGEFSLLEESQSEPLEERIAKHLARNGAASATAIHSAIGGNRTNISTLLSTNERFTRLDKKGKEVLYGLAAEGSSRATRQATRPNEELPF